MFVYVFLSVFFPVFVYCICMLIAVDQGRFAKATAGGLLSLQHGGQFARAGGMKKSGRISCGFLLSQDIANTVH